MMQMRIEGVPFSDREHAVELARAIVAGDRLPEAL
jgi:hypothetical protein